ncbi:hypothetical protein [Streptosporangium vulgare]|uniref:Uncharacterized protein n=1 Tax=Streptosporangium vulgare TaxID=46190 RepID=A0ABV5TLM9_9ACTN
MARHSRWATTAVLPGPSALRTSMVTPSPPGLKATSVPQKSHLHWRHSRSWLRRLNRAQAGEV